ncbi:pyruvate:ferredoxin (flavodoxin) oxidoreductase [Serratia rubidaea]|uniref:Pyruvate:ferredoxin (Flavodoxin) oxidoreductase n=1 Tax=Serratia rubidaea TaxID=61652 RepID=A0A447QUB9_SERRU|nr:pyruvate:ferredoxin (flavodoxin) oxidoreductase [Serratia rubidaea]
MSALAEAFSRGERATLPLTIGGRYGLSSKEFGPDCALAVFAELALERPRPRFTVGIFDDVSGLSLPLHDNPLPSAPRWRRCSTASAATAPSPPPRTTSKSSAIARRCLPRATLSTIRKRPAA